MTENEVFNTVYERIRAARVQSGLTQEQVARLLSYQRPTISEIEAGRRKVSSDELVSFAKVFGVSIEWLASGDVPGEDPNVQLAARELAKLKSEDLNRVLKLLRTLRRAGGNR